MKVHELVLLLLAEDITKLEQMNGADQMAGERGFGASADHGPETLSLELITPRVQT
jgi:hypothetical protein